MRPAQWSLVLALCIVTLGGGYAKAFIFGDDKKDATERLPGRRIEELVAVLGYPESSAQVGDRTVYVWNHRTLSTTDQPVYEDPLLGGKRKGTVTTSKQLQCTFKAVFGDHGGLVDWSFEGNEGACRHFYRKLRELPKGAPGAIEGVCTERAGCGPDYARRGPTKNSYIVYNAYEFTAPESWSEYKADIGKNLIVIGFARERNVHQCELVAKKMPQSGTDDFWQNVFLKVFGRIPGVTIEQDQFTEGDTVVRMARVDFRNAETQLVKLIAYRDDLLVVRITGGLESPDKLKRDDAGLGQCPLRRLAAASLTPQDMSPPPASAPQSSSTAMVRRGEAPNTLIVFDDYEVSAPPLWRQTDLDNRDGIVSAQFQLVTSCLIVGVPVSEGTADEVWNNSLENYAEHGKIVAQESFVENGVPVRIALGQEQGRTPTVFKLSAYEKATFIVITNGGIDSPNQLKRNDQAFYYCTVRALPGRR